MVTCTLLDDKASGRFGNKLFIIAALIGCAENHEDVVLLPEWQYENIFKNGVKTYPLSDMKLMASKSYREPCFSYKEIPYSSGMDLIGYFQSEKYFKQSKDSIYRYFEFTDEIQEEINKQYFKYKELKTASIHIRRGDYLKYPDIHPVCDAKYYNDAMARLNMVDKFLVFSDDPKWCKENFDLNVCDVIEGNVDFVDMGLMSKCDHNIIANSSFSWWGAWLNKNPEKIVIAPNNWFGENGPKDTGDLIPEGWIIL